MLCAAASTWLPSPQQASGQRVVSGTRPRWSPNSKLLAFLDKQIKVYDVADRSVRNITDAKGPITSFSWSPDASAMFYISSDSGPTPDPIVVDRDYRYGRLYWQPVSGGPAKLITKADRHVISFSVSPDASRVVYAAQPTPRDRDAFNVDLYEIDPSSGAERALVAQPGRDADPSYSPDGRWIAFHSQAGSQNYFEARHVAIVPSTGGPARYCTRKHDADVFRNGNSFNWASDSRSITYTAGQGIQDVLLKQDLSSDKVEVLTERIAGSASCTPDGNQCVLLKTSPERPAEVYLYHKGTEKQLTHLQDRCRRLAPLSIRSDSMEGVGRTSS